MNESDLQHGAIPINRVRRTVNKKIFREKLAGGIGFDWTTGFDVRNDIGAILIKNQGNNSSCGGQAGSYFLEIQRRRQNIVEGPISAKSVYSPIAYKGGGTTISALMSQVGAHGGNLESAVSSVDINGNPLSEVFMASKAWETPALLTDALLRGGYLPYDIGEGIDDVANAIKSYGAVIWEINGQNNGTWTSPTPKPPIKGQGDIWSHFMCAIGTKLINGKKTIVALQSMGPGWGDQGIQYFDEEYFNSGYIVDAFTFVYETELLPTSDNYSPWAEVLRWFRIFLKKAQGIIRGSEI